MRNEDRGNPYILLITVLGIYKQGIQSALTLPSVLGIIKKHSEKLEPDWLRIFEFPGIVRILLANTTSEMNEIDKTLNYLIDVYAGADASELDKLLTYVSFCSADLRFSEVIVSKMFKVFANVDADKVPAWVLDVLESKLLLLIDKTELHENTAKMAEKFRNHPGLFMVAGKNVP